MPVITNETVETQPYETSGNGGRKLITLSNKTVVAVFKTLTGYGMRYKTGNNIWIVVKSVQVTNLVDVALVPMGTDIGVIYSYNNSQVAFSIFKVDGTQIGTTVTIDTNQTAIGNVSLAINEAGTELYATWASKNSTYPNSFNIRYEKGTINTDGSVVWGAVEQLSTFNESSTNLRNPSLSLKDEKAYILVEFANGSTMNDTRLLTNSFTTKDTHNLNINANWGFKFVYSGSSYLQSSPSAIFVPQRINGLANGLMAVAWHGTDSTHTTTNYIRFSKATDGTGATWSAMKKLVPGTNATLTANKSGKLFITYEDAGVTKRIESTDNGDNWSTAITVGTGTNPSSLFDLTMDMSVPLTVRKGTSSVLFTGSWITLTNSVPSGDIGQKTSKDNLLTYAVTTDGTMSTITEKVNGVTVGTKTATSGQSLTVALTQAQWDAVKYGKYANTTGGRNTLTIEMGTEVWTYTFDNIPPVDAQITELLKSHIDSADVAIPAKKSLLGASIRGKGGTVNDADSLEVMASAIGGIPLGKKFASGTTTSVSGGSFVNQAGNPVTSSYISVTGLSFSPKVVVVYRDSNPTTFINGRSSIGSNGYKLYRVDSENYRQINELTNSGFILPVTSSGFSYYWEAFE